MSIALLQLLARTSQRIEKQGIFLTQATTWSTALRAISMALDITCSSGRMQYIL